MPCHVVYVSKGRRPRNTQVSYENILGRQNGIRSALLPCPSAFVPPDAGYSCLVFRLPSRLSGMVAPPHSIVTY
ncbi:hypothetical protein JAAARDRAFT_31269, partial [Jaapia argillacea MUCL 33604]